VGSWGEYGAFSFFPSKVLGGAGDGGLVLTSAERASKVRALRQHGSSDRRIFGQVGGNFRLDALQAAILSVKLPHLGRWLEGRRRVAADYRSALAELDLPGVRLPPVEPGVEHAYNHFVVQCERRDGLARFLEERGISSAAHYATPLHLQPCFAQLGYTAGAFPVAERAARTMLALPMYPELVRAQVDAIARAIADFSRHT
jgi:dTDP-4-amino-4,6-dideoxygalactose transaminase